MSDEEPSPSAADGPALPAAAIPAGDQLGARSGLGPAPDAHVPYSLKVAAGWAWRLLAVAGALWVVGQVAGALTFALVAVFVGAVMTSLVKPLVDRLDRVLPRGIAVAISLIASIAVVIAILTFIVAAFVNQIPQLSAEVADGFASLRDWLRTTPIQADSAQIDQVLTTAQDWLKSNGADLAGGVLGGVGTVGEMLTGLALALFAAIFLLYDGIGIYTWIVETTPKRVQPTFRTSGYLAWGTFSAYARGTVIIALTNAILVSIALTVLKVPLPIPLALLVFFGTFIPFIGSPVAMFAAALIALAANGPLSFVAVIVAITVIGQLEGNVLQPLIMSKQVALHPLVVILTVTMGGLTAGIIGAVVAVPIVSVLWVVVRYLTGRDPEHPRDPVADDVATSVARSRSQ